MTNSHQQTQWTIEVYTDPLGSEQREKIGSFYSALREELETFQLSSDQMFLSERAYAVCDREGQIVGLAGVRKKSLMGVLFMVVQASHQGKGVGKQLMTRLMEDVGPFKILMLSVQENNVPARELYARFNFSTIFQKQAVVYMLYRNLAGIVACPLIVGALFFKSLCGRND